jgi:hypothetical protein
MKVTNFVAAAVILAATAIAAPTDYTPPGGVSVSQGQLLLAGLNNY